MGPLACDAPCPYTGGPQPTRPPHMTRINLIPPAQLVDKHLGAEYRELPRVYGLVRNAQARGMHPSDYHTCSAPFLLGPGHVKFFYTRLHWLNSRYAALVAECLHRGWRINHPLPPDHDIHRQWFGNWVPTIADVTLSQARITAKLPPPPPPLALEHQTATV